MLFRSHCGFEPLAGATGTAIGQLHFPLRSQPQLSHLLLQKKHSARSSPHRLGRGFLICGGRLPRPSERPPCPHQIVASSRCWWASLLPWSFWSQGNIGQRMLDLATAPAALFFRGKAQKLLAANSLRRGATSGAVAVFFIQVDLAHCRLASHWCGVRSSSAHWRAPP